MAAREAVKAPAVCEAKRRCSPTAHAECCPNRCRTGGPLRAEPPGWLLKWGDQHPWTPLWLDTRLRPPLAQNWAHPDANTAHPSSRPPSPYTHVALMRESRCRDSAAQDQCRRTRPDAPPRLPGLLRQPLLHPCRRLSLVRQLLEKVVSEEALTYRSTLPRLPRLKGGMEEIYAFVDNILTKLPVQPTMSQR